MGGWRKMWFVLQNQLLLSYSSKEDYEKKLVPFKDVINLGPGTIIIPTAALPRFTIETATNIFYTFVSNQSIVTFIIVMSGMRLIITSIQSNSIWYNSFHLHSFSHPWNPKIHTNQWKWCCENNKMIFFICFSV